MPATDGPLPTSQGVTSSTFRAAPHGHNVSVAGLYQYHAEHSPLHPAFAYADVQTGALHDINYATVWKDVSAIGNVISNHYNASAGLYATRGQQDKRPVIGILAVADTLSYIYLEIALMALGYIAFPISHRNNVNTIVRLLKTKDVVQLFVSSDDGTQTVAKKVFDVMHADGLGIELLPMLNYVDVRRLSDVTVLKFVDVEDNDTVAIYHSTGTTGFPKPIPFSRRGLMNLANIPLWGEVDLCGKRLAAHTNPVFHVMGLASLMWPLTSGAIFTFYNPNVPPPIPTPSNFLENWIAGQCNVVFCVPIFVEAWAREEKNLPALKALDCIIFSGAPLAKSIGDQLAAEGVVLHPFWGSTEVGPATMFIPRNPPPPGDWEYFSFTRQIKFEMKPYMDNVYEAIMIGTPNCFPALTNCVVDGEPAYAMGDLLERHPTDSRKWKMFGRSSELIQLKDGRKFNPTTHEEVLLRDPNITAAIIFGTSHFYPGVLLELNTTMTGAVGEVDKLTDMIWPTIEKLNAQSGDPSQQIRRESIVIVNPQKPLERTVKGTPRRPVCLELYASEIAAVYKDEKSLTGDLELPGRR